MWARCMLFAMAALSQCDVATAFAPKVARGALAHSKVLRAEPEPPVDAAAPKKTTLEEKMSSWEATEEEQKAATLGGLIPGSSGFDGFDFGLYAAFPLLFGSLAIFLFFPFAQQFGFDFASVGPPPTV
ncbi:hypothetical protein M885DRAFT_506656 [Pelagophyceae sp. CCMP2097]|nr:hypothetical protein M885DRAFT_506656 [Pelagophyceae sp. CCMP2097]|mmetsp:Transcript_6907/g.22397  ORF Transcript_6907/g.22397 Transcript_6907/m.22397 type:complete len:128 (-) Transcript_6907:74-457(-)